MSVAIDKIRSLCTPAEVTIVQASRRPEIEKLTLADAGKYAAQARKLLEKWQDQGRSQGRARAKAVGVGAVADRTAEKISIFNESLAAFEKRVAELAATAGPPSAAVTAKTPASGAGSKIVRKQATKKVRQAEQKAIRAADIPAIAAVSPEAGPPKIEIPAAATPPAATPARPPATAASPSAAKPAKAGAKGTVRKSARTTDFQSADAPVQRTGSPFSALASGAKPVKKAAKKAAKKPAKKAVKKAVKQSPRPAKTAAISGPASASPAKTTAGVVSKKKKSPAVASSITAKSLQRAPEVAISKKARVQASGKNTKIRGHVSAKGKRAQGKRDSKG